jgi:hypothetical protein
VLKDSDIFFQYAGVDGVPLVWVIGEDCLYDIPVSVEHSKMFLENDAVIDVSEEYPENDGITVRFMKNNEVLEELHTSEYFGSILLSNPTVLNLIKYAYGKHVESPYAKFINNEFVILNQDAADISPW